jgi:hypothetical protein
VSERRYGTKRLYQVRMEGLAPVKEFLSTIEIELDGDGTTLRFSHRGLPNDEAVQSHAHGGTTTSSASSPRQAAATPGPIRGSPARCRTASPRRAGG